MRYALLWVSLLMAIGCQGNQPMNFTPFPTAGPTLMPPPGTGSAGRPDPYYRPSPTTPTPGMQGAYGSAPLPAQFARFTSEDDPATQMADSRAGYDAPLAPSGSTTGSAFGTTTAPMSPAMAPAVGGQPPGPAVGQPAPMSPVVSGGATQLPPSQPVNAPVGGWSDRY